MVMLLLGCLLKPPFSSVFFVLFLVMITVVFIRLVDVFLGKIRFSLVDLNHQRICINATVYTKFGRIQHFNLGDDLNYYLLKKIQRKKISLYSQSLLKSFNSCNFIVVGSTLSFLTNAKSVVWGAGVIDDNVPLPCKPARVCAVRGPLTRQYLLKRGVSCPPVYGDPALLMRYVYYPQIEKKYKLGVIPHYTDFNSKKFDELKRDPDVLFIRMNSYKSVEDVINQILSCEHVISSSLHGLILSESYSVPNIWIKVSDNILGGNFKYLDYYGSLGLTNVLPRRIDGHETLNEILSFFEDYRKGRIDLKNLIDAAPFELCLKGNV